MTQRVLITGGFGFVGSQLLSMLARRNDISVAVVDNFVSGSRLSTKGIKFIHGDIRNPQLAEKWVKDFDTIIHLAAIVGEPACLIDPTFAYDTNVIGTRNILQAMTDGQRIIFTSSSSVYGNRPDETVNEDTLPLPLNNYSQQKYTAEKEIIASGRDYIILRPATAFGVSERTRMDLLVNNLIYDALTTQLLQIYEPNTMRPIIHVIDFARILIEAMDGRMGNNEIYNIADNTYNVTKWILASHIATLCAAKVVLAEGTNLDPRDYDIAVNKLLNTGFQFPMGRVELAIEQIKSVQHEIALKPKTFTAPYRVKAFLKKELD